LKITVLTSSRADYGILRPLMVKLNSDKKFDLRIVAFGSHNSKFYGNTAQEIEKDGLKIFKKIDTLLIDDSPGGISKGIGLTFAKFAEFWSENVSDLILCLGDRYEMFAAVGAAVPFNIPIAHISGGEITEGAIDNIYRNSLSLMATYHFASTEIYQENIVQLCRSDKHVYNVGALNYDNLVSMDYYSIEEFKQQFEIDLNHKTILITFHPETVSFERNTEYAEQLILALEESGGYQQLITMPNADTSGMIIREKLIDYSKNTTNRVQLVESLGWKGYLSAIKLCSFLLGNTSSGFVEASFFPKNVINLGNRQKGRIITDNIFCCEVEKNKILTAISKVTKKTEVQKVNLYGDGNASSKILAILSEITKK